MDVGDKSLSAGREAHALGVSILDYRLALGAARELSNGFQTSDNKTRFRKCQQGLLDAAAECLRQLGKADEASELESLYFPSEEQVAEEQDQATRRRQKTWQRAAWLFMVVNLLIGSGILFFVRQYAAESAVINHDWVLFPGLLGGACLFFAAFAGIWEILMYLVRLILPDVRPEPRVLLFLGLCPWLMLVVGLMAHLASKSSLFTA